MKEKAKEKIYLAVTVLCLLMCGAMIVGMFTQSTDFVLNHTPALREMPEYEELTPVTAENEDASTAGEIAVTEDFVNQNLNRFLPEDFPLKNPNVKIGADGIITFSGKIAKGELRNYLKSNGIKLGFKYSLALLLLPSEFETEASLKISSKEDGELTVEPYSLFIAGKNIPTAIFPQKMTDALNDAVNKLVKSIGVLRFSGFEDGAVIFSAK